MPQLLKNTRSGLMRQRQTILEDLAKKEPVLTAKLKAVLIALDQPEILTGDYALIKKPFEAVVKFLEDRNEWCEKTTIARGLLDGGFTSLQSTEPKRLTGYITRVVDYSVDRGKLQGQGDLIGLPGWTAPEPARQVKPHRSSLHRPSHRPPQLSLAFMIRRGSHHSWDGKRYMRRTRD